VGLVLAMDDGAACASLYNAAVDPGWQRRGLGGALLAHAVRALLRRGCCSVTLAADAGRVGWYCRLGFLPDEAALMVL
jgi:ribosomal protein S18 acetylase RimI-like enzyme